MSLSKKRLAKARIYLILDAQVLDYARLLSVLKETVRFGIDIVQLRDKFGCASDILSFTRHALKITRHQIPFILNDRVDLAILSGADGVHLGQDDIPILDARRLLKSNAIIGCSCQTQAHIKKAQIQGVDYIGFGSIFKTLTKPERNPMNLKMLQQIHSVAHVPLFPIGGISRKNVNVLTDLGFSRAAVCRDILLAKNPGKAVEEFKNVLG
jgi:thiamine-phosphate pyrophosphorylase